MTLRGVDLTQHRKVLALVAQLAVWDVLDDPEPVLAGELDDPPALLQGERRPRRVLEVGHEVQERRDLALQRRLQTLDADAVLFERDADGVRPATPERLDGPVVTRLLRVDRRAGTDQVRRHEVLQLQGTVADEYFFRRDPVLRSQLLPQRRVPALLAVLQHDARVLTHHRIEASSQLFGRERLRRRHPTGKDYLLARRHVNDPRSLSLGTANPIPYPTPDATVIRTTSRRPHRASYEPFWPRPIG